MIIYKATNKENGKVYIGQTIETLELRMKRHLRDKRGNNHFHNSIMKNGSNNFEWEILKICTSIDELNEMETFYIKEYDSFNVGYNSTTGGGNRKLSEETKDKIRSSHKGKKKTQDHVDNIKKSGTLFGDKPVWNKGKKGLQVAWNKGLTNIYTDDTLDKMRKPKNDEHKRKISESNKKRSFIRNEKGQFQKIKNEI